MTYVLWFDAAGPAGTDWLETSALQRPGVLAGLKQVKSSRDAPRHCGYTRHSGVADRTKGKEERAELLPKLASTKTSREPERSSLELQSRAPNGGSLSY